MYCIYCKYVCIIDIRNHGGSIREYLYTYESWPIELASKLQTLTKPSLVFWHWIQFDQFQNYNPQMYLKWILKKKIWTKYNMTSLQICPCCVSILNSMLFLFVFSDFKISSMCFFIIPPKKSPKVHWSSEYWAPPLGCAGAVPGQASGGETCQPHLNIGTWTWGIPRISWKRRF